MNISGFSQQGFAIENEDLLSLADKHQLHQPIPDYLSGHFRLVLDNEVERSFGSLTLTRNLRQCKDLFTHLVQFCRWSGNDDRLFKLLCRCAFDVTSSLLKVETKSLEQKYCVAWALAIEVLALRSCILFHWFCMPRRLCYLAAIKQMNCTK